MKLATNYVNKLEPKPKTIKFYGKLAELQLNERHWLYLCLNVYHKSFFPHSILTDKNIPNTITFS